MGVNRYLPDRVFFIADSHFGHANIINHMNRPFNDVNDMEVQMILSWNKKVKKTDTVFVLGDFCWKERDIIRLRDLLNGFIVFLRGNHDKGFTKRGIVIHDRLEIKVADPDCETGFQHLVLDHYPLASWNLQHYGSWMIHGHTHKGFVNKGASYDVGEIYEPLSYDELKFLINKKLNTPDFQYGEIIKNDEKEEEPQNKIKRFLRKMGF